jgi:hypothetical protein
MITAKRERGFISVSDDRPGFPAMSQEHKDILVKVMTKGREAVLAGLEQEAKDLDAFDKTSIAMCAFGSLLAEIFAAITGSGMLAIDDLPEILDWQKSAIIEICCNNQKE